LNGTILSDVELSTRISRACHYLTLSISEMVEDMDIVTVEY